MSLSATKRVWDDTSVAGSRRMLLLALADFANDQGIAYPGVPKLAQMTCLTERRVQQLLSKLIDEGRITRIANRGRGRFDCFRLAVCCEQTAAGTSTPPTDFEIQSTQMGAEDFTHSPQKGAEDFTHSPQKGAEGFTHSSQIGAEGFTHLSEMGAEDFTHSAPMGAENFTHSEPERVKSSEKRVKFSAERVKLSAQMGETLPHTRVDPFLIHTNNQQQIRESSFAPPPTAKQLVEEVRRKVREERASDETWAQAGSASVPVAVAQLVGKVAEARTAEQTPQQRYFGMVCWIVGWDHKTLSKEQQGQVAQTVGVLQRAEYSDEDLRRFWSEIWQQDWRWKRERTRPTLNQVRAEIGKLRAGADVGTQRASPERDKYGKPILTPEELELQAKMREARNRGKGDPNIPLSQRLHLSDL